MKQVANFSIDKWRAEIDSRLLLSLQEICEILIFQPLGDSPFTFQLKLNLLQSASNSKITKKTETVEVSGYLNLQVHPSLI